MTAAFTIGAGDTSAFGGYHDTAIGHASALCRGRPGRGGGPWRRHDRAPACGDLVWPVSSESSNDVLEAQLAEAAKLLKANQLVAFPTETVYGLGGGTLPNHHPPIAAPFAARKHGRTGGFIVACVMSRYLE